MVIPHNESHIFTLEVSKLTIAFVILVLGVTILASLLSISLQKKIQVEAGELHNVNQSVIHERENYFHNYALLNSGVDLARKKLVALFEHSEYDVEDELFFNEEEVLYDEAESELNEESKIFREEIKNHINNTLVKAPLSPFTANIIGQIDKGLVKDTFKFEPVVISFRKLHKKILELYSAINSYRGFIQKRLQVQKDLPYYWVADGGKYTSFFGMRKSPFNYERVFHAGVDLAAPVGTAIYAAADGLVTVANRNSGYGLMVKIKHKFGYETLYAHLSAIKVSIGQEVRQGQLIGRMGSTGRVTGVHLHYEVRVLDKAINPLVFLISS